MATRRSATILLLLLMSVASSIELEPLVAAGAKIVGSAKTTLDSLPVLDFGTRRGVLAGAPELCTVLTPIAQQYQTLCSAVENSAGALGLGGLLNDVRLQGANLDAVKTIVLDVPSEILSKSGLPPSVLDYTLGTLRQVTPDLRGFPSFTIETVDGTLGRTLGVTTVLDDIPGFGIVEGVKSDLSATVDAAGNVVFGPIGDVKGLAETAFYTVTDPVADVL